MYLQLLKLFLLQVNFVVKSSHFHWLLSGLLRWFFLDVQHAQFWLLSGGTRMIQLACGPLIVEVLVVVQLIGELLQGDLLLLILWKLLFQLDGARGNFYYLRLLLHGRCRPLHADYLHSLGLLLWSCWLLDLFGALFDLFLKSLFFLFVDLSEDLQLLLALSLFFLALLLLPPNLELHFLLLAAHFIRAHLIEKFLLHAHLLLNLHHDQLLDHGLLVVRCELFSRLFSLSLGPNPLLALQFDCPKPVMVLVQQPTFQDLIRRLEDDEFWHLELEFRSIGLLIGRGILLSRDNLSNGTGF